MNAQAFEQTRAGLAIEAALLAVHALQPVDSAAFVEPWLIGLSLIHIFLRKLAMPLAARVRIGPAEMALTRVPSGPRLPAR